ncbi:hypothetical protein BDY17DRAFT_125640 [Neohortaea acidophila]|uniref:Uncharacterized protein n=1 Tax=Neohortaea acidophila TaxID=245834 RepID=A0A6A6PX82_9PEZI|nr:uncharacterized protein BDY17DRAFT_125640 [Neohortaea acidophila]KAF2484309.1 hypothetical protein BDY17DRAFT_125640 [Neohortaea acidophila]
MLCNKVEAGTKRRRSVCICFSHLALFSLACQRVPSVTHRGPRAPNPPRAAARIRNWALGDLARSAAMIRQARARQPPNCANESCWAVVVPAHVSCNRRSLVSASPAMKRSPAASLTSHGATRPARRMSHVAHTHTHTLSSHLPSFSTPHCHSFQRRDAARSRKGRCSCACPPTITCKKSEPKA